MVNGLKDHIERNHMFQGKPGKSMILSNLSRCDVWALVEQTIKFPDLRRAPQRSQGTDEFIKRSLPLLLEWTVRQLCVAE